MHLMFLVSEILIFIKLVGHMEKINQIILDQ